MPPALHRHWVVGRQAFDELEDERQILLRLLGCGFHVLVHFNAMFRQEVFQNPCAHVFVAKLGQSLLHSHAVNEVLEHVAEGPVPEIVHEAGQAHARHVPGIDLGLRRVESAEDSGDGRRVVEKTWATSPPRALFLKTLITRKSTGGIGLMRGQRQILSN